jgi:hypothetical protein
MRPCDSLEVKLLRLPSRLSQPYFLYGSTDEFVCYFSTELLCDRYSSIKSPVERLLDSVREA